MFTATVTKNITLGYKKSLKISKYRGRRGHDGMVVGFTTICAINAYLY
jgi:hypothetical protein